MNQDLIVQTMQRKQGIGQATPTRHSTLRHAAEALSRRVVDAAVIELLNEALARVTLLCYERDETGTLVNVDGTTGRVLVPLPWGRAGYSKWGLTSTEATVMRRVMFTRMRQGLPLFFYERSRRCWYLNLAEYRNGDVVLAQLGEWEITIAEYRKARG